ncbi:MAG: hypothetical protein ABIC04_07720 [Nanoarchaeota archaeon]
MVKASELTTIVFCIIIVTSVVYAIPVGPTVTYRSNTTKSVAAPTVVNYTGSGDKAGGYIFTINLSSNQQNSRWKAFVGNVSGTLVLADANDYSIYDWSISTSLTGEVYATRASSTVNWSTIKCAFANATIWEERLINHTTNVNDNISTTFSSKTNSEFDVGIVTINAYSCPTINLFVNGSAATNDQFEEILLYDGRNYSLNLTSVADLTGFGNIVYASILEQNEYGYNNNVSNTSFSKYDFQIMVPEVGLTSWEGSTAYYFYVELT